MIRLLSSVACATEAKGVQPVSGITVSRERAEGRRWAWPLRLGGLDFTLWETIWSTAERELVLGKRDVGTSTPIAIVNLMSRRRALIESMPEFEYMSARRVDPDADGWPRFSNCGEDDLQTLIPPAADEVLRGLGYLGYATRMEALDVSGRHRGQLLGLFARGSRSAQVCFYVLTRLVPTFRHAGVLGGSD